MLMGMFRRTIVVLFGVVVQGSFFVGAEESGGGIPDDGTKTFETGHLEVPEGFKPDGGVLGVKFPVGEGSDTSPSTPDVEGVRGVGRVDAGVLSDIPFKRPIFVEMGQDPGTIKLPIEPVGKRVAFVFDIDDTLYHPRDYLQAEEKKFLKRMYDTLTEDRDTPPFMDSLVRTHLYSRTFYEDCGMSLEEYWEMLDGFDYMQYVKPNQELREFLLSMDSSIRRFCFTNGPRDRAENILTGLGVIDCFEVVIHLGKYDTTFCCKPHDASYAFVASVLGIETPENIYFFDDTKLNTDKADVLGWNGYWTTPERHIFPSMALALSDLENNRRRLLAGLSQASETARAVAE